MAERELRTSLCTDLESLVQDVTYNSQTQNEINNILFQTIQEIEVAGTSDHKVSVNADDNAALGYDYLHAKIDQSSTSDAFGGQVAVRSTSVSPVSSIVEFFQADLASVTGWTDGSFIFLTADAGELSWQAVDINSGVDNYTVMVTGGDTHPSYLHDAFHRNATYVGDADILIGTQSEDTGGTGGHDYKERLFVDVSEIMGHVGTGFFVLAIENNISKYVTIQTISEELIDETFLVAIEKYRAIRGKATAGTASDVTTFTIDNIVVLDSGKDPRVDTGSAAETVTIYNTPVGEAHADNADVWADYNELAGHWEARPASSSDEDDECWARVIDDEIPAATDNLAAHWGPGHAQPMNNATGKIVGSPGGDGIAVYNSTDSVYVVGARVRLKGTEVIYGSCGPYPWADDADAYEN